MKRTTHTTSTLLSLLVLSSLLFGCDSVGTSQEEVNLPKAPNLIALPIDSTGSDLSQSDPNVTLSTIQTDNTVKHSFKYNVKSLYNPSEFNNTYSVTKTIPSISKSFTINDNINKLSVPNDYVLYAGDSFYVHARTNGRHYDYYTKPGPDTTGATYAPIYSSVSLLSGPNQFVSRVVVYNDVDVINRLPSRVNPISPAEGAYAQSSMSFSWQPTNNVTSMDGVKYKVLVSTTNNMSNIIYDSGYIINTSWSISNFDFASDYWWTVTACNGANTNVCAPPSLIRKINKTTIPDAPSFSHNTYLYGYTTFLNIPFTWNPAPGGNVHYEFQVDNNSDFSSPVVNQNNLSSPSYNWTDHQLRVNSSNPSPYYYRVRAHNEAGAGSWTTKSMTWVTFDPETAPVFKGPKGTTVTATVSSISDVPSYSGYQFHWYSSTSSTGPWVDTGVTAKDIGITAQINPVYLKVVVSQPGESKTLYTRVEAEAACTGPFCP